MSENSKLLTVKLVILVLGNVVYLKQNKTKKWDGHIGLYNCSNKLMVSKESLQILVA